MWADQATQRDLTNPLLPNSPGKNNKPDTAPTVSDTDGSDRWFRPSDYEEDDAPANRRVRLPKKSHLDEFLTFDPLGHIKMIGVISRVNCNTVIKL